MKGFQPITKVSHTPPDSATTLFCWQLKHAKFLNKQKYLQNRVILLQLLYHLSRINTRYMSSMILRDLEINIRIEWPEKSGGVIAITFVVAYDNHTTPRKCAISTSQSSLYKEGKMCSIQPLSTWQIDMLKIQLRGIVFNAQPYTNFSWKTHFQCALSHDDQVSTMELINIK